MYVCTYVCMYACMHVCMYVCLYVFMHVCMYVYVCVLVFLSCENTSNTIIIMIVVTEAWVRCEIDLTMFFQIAFKYLSFYTD